MCFSCRRSRLEVEKFSKKLNPVIWQISTPTDPGMISLLDVTGGGMLDLIVQNDDDTSTGWLVYRNTGSNFVTTPFNYSIPKTDRQFIQWMDIKGDGMQELVVNNHDGNSTTGTLSVYDNTGTNLSNTPETWTVPATAPYSMSFQDMNGDGRPDIVVQRQDIATGAILIDVWLNAEGSFIYSGTINLIGTAPSMQAYNDINGDGAYDSVIYNNDGTVTVYPGVQNFNYLLAAQEANNLTIAYNYDNVNNGLGFTKTVLKQSTIMNGLPPSDPGYVSQAAYYSYDQGKYDSQNRFMYWFGKVTGYDAISNKSVVYYSQAKEDMIGHVLTNEKYVGTNQALVSRIISDYMEQSMYGGISTNILITDTVNIAWSLDQTEIQAERTDYKYYGIDTNSDSAADNYFLLYQKINRQPVTGQSYSIEINNANDVYQQYGYTGENTSYNITPKVSSSEIYMIRTDNSIDTNGIIQYYFKGEPFGQIGNNVLVLEKKAWNGTNGTSDKWISQYNSYDPVNQWLLTGTTISNENGIANTVVETTFYFYDSNLRFITETSNTYGNNKNLVETSQTIPDMEWGMPLQVIDNNNQTNLLQV